MKKNKLEKSEPDDEIQICDYKIVDCFLYAIIGKEIEISKIKDKGEKLIF